MTETAPSLASIHPSRSDQTFPTLTPAQAARVAAHGTARPVRPGEVLIEPGAFIEAQLTSLPGVFAVGDVWGGNITRVASAVGEGSVAVAFVHQVLHE
jgi:NADPH-dependent glutamate synthase beta subunit-like oxidoreductase